MVLPGACRRGPCGARHLPDQGGESESVSARAGERSETSEMRARAEESKRERNREQKREQTR
eukprot:2858823-Rhodomonas_salina.1